MCPKVWHILHVGGLRPREVVDVVAGAWLVAGREEDEDGSEILE